MHGNQVSESSFIVSSSLQRELTESGVPPQGVDCTHLTEYLLATYIGYTHHWSDF